MDPLTCETSLLSPFGSPPYPADFSQAQNSIFRGTDMRCIDGIIPGPGSNLELGPETGAFATQATVLRGRIPSNGAVGLSNLVFADWINPNKAGLTLAERVVFDAIFINCGITGIPSNALVPLAQRFLAGPVPIPAARLSDPNISFVNNGLNGKVTIGLAGRNDVSDLLPPELKQCPFQIPNPDRFAASEVVKYTYRLKKGNKKTKALFSTYLYSFFPIPSDTVNDINPKQHTATYVVSPTNEPPLGEKIGILQDFPNVRWEMEWTNPNPTSVAMKVVDPIGDGQTFAGDLKCDGMFKVPGRVNPICKFNPGKKEVRFAGLVPPGGTVKISFLVTTDLLDPINMASMCWDSIGSGKAPSIKKCKQKNGTEPVRVKGEVLPGT